MTFVAIVAEWKGAYCGRINSFKYVHSWYVLVTFSTLLPAIYAIVTLEGLFSRELEGKHIMRKLIAVKGILLVILVQSNLLSFLDASGRMTFTSLWTLSRFECLLVVCEMLVSSLVLGAFFSYREFKEAKVLTVVELEGVGNSASEFVRVQRAQEYYGTH
ncbi:hypothetical protein BC830DRAFT_1174973 [Chytriomyces sp. MP71]|nr:hypothetical protein BC830DRAFT_1174973 [Chytriomyces sp. MP71]